MSAASSSRTTTRVALGDLLTVRNEIIHPRDSPSGPDIFVGLEHIESGTGRRLGSQHIEKSQMTGRKARFRAGDIVYGYLRPYLNKVWVADFEGLCSVDQYVYRCDKRRVDHEFIAFFMRSPVFLSRAPVDSGPGQLPRIRLREIGNVEMDLPPFLEQQRIAASLRKQMAAVAHLRAAAATQESAADRALDSHLRDAFPVRTPLSVGMEEEPAPRGWDWHLLTGLARLESGHTPSRRHPEWWDGDIPWLALPDIRELDCQVSMDTGETTNDLGIANSSARVLPAGTVVLSRTASVGFVAIMGRPMATSQDFVNWVCGPDLDPRFLMYLLRVARPAIREMSSGAIHKTVYVPTVKAFRVCIPPIREQRQIAARIASRMLAAEDLQRRTRDQLANVNRLPAAILRQAFA
jgi:type I restriction enzyme S subunit